ncbi:MAG: hypothetical protein RRZ24_10290 [Clostridia bacterium]
MALTQYRIPLFFGIHQGMCENALDSGDSPDACNMDTFGCNLAVARGYVRHSELPLESPANIHRLFVWNRPSGTIFLAAVGSKLLALHAGAAAWRSIYVYPGIVSNTVMFDFQVLKIQSTEYLLIANGRDQLLKWDGIADMAVLFGSSQGLSNLPVNYVELYFNRLFAAGDPAHPCRLYWSRAPGDTRTIEDWSAAQEGENVSGGHVEIGTDSDPITGIFALSNQLLIFKRDSLYRLLGDRPGNYRICPINAAMRQPVHTSIIHYGDVLYFLTDGGMYYYDGQNVRRQPDADKVQTLLEKADLSACRAAACRDVLYFALREQHGAQTNDAVLTYDLARGTYMVRRGFIPRDLFSSGGILYLLDENGYLCRFNEGDSYAGEPIQAYWNTPMTDLSQKISGKHLQELYLRGTGGILAVEARSGDGATYYERILPGKNNEVLEIPLSGDGRAFSLRFSNVNGSRLTVEGGVELLIDLQRRVL